LSHIRSTVLSDGVSPSPKGAEPARCSL